MQLQFVREVVNRMDVGQRKTRVGVLTFSDEITQPVVSLSQSFSKAAVLNNINNQTLPYREGLTYTNQAIRFARTSSEWRQDITKVIVVLTDGGSREPGNTALEAAQAKEDGFYMFVIGVGQYTDEREWKAVASDPDESFIYNITNFAFLDSLKTSLPPRACNLPPIVQGGACGVQQPVDLFYVAGPSGTTDALQLIQEMNDGMSDGGDQLRINYIIEACAIATDKSVSDDLDQYCDSLTVPDIVTEDTYSNLISRMRESATEAGRDRNAKQVAVMFVDDESMRLGRYAIVNEARGAEQFDKIEIIVVDLGVRGYANYVQGMAQMRNNVVRFLSGSLYSQSEVKAQLLDRTCEAMNRERNLFNADVV